jgi:hypothetical protein
MDPTLYTHPSPLSGPWDSKANNLPPLPTTISHDGKSLVNVHPAEGSTEGPVARSAAYERFVAPLDNGIRGGFDVHIYYFQENPILLKFARELHERIRRECKFLLQICFLRRCAATVRIWRPSSSERAA